MLVLSVVTLAVAAAPTVGGTALWPLVALAWGGLAAGLAVDALALQRTKLTLALDAPSATGVGGLLKVAVSLERNSPLRVWVRSEVEAPLVPKHEARFGRSQKTTWLRYDAPERGLGGIPAVWTKLEGPLRLLHRVERHAVNQKVRVVPSAERMKELALASQGQEILAGSHLTRRKGDGGEFDALEAYQPGMDLRHVDWKASARYQSLRVRRYRVEQNQRLVVCVDTGRLMKDRVEGLERLDHAVHAALLLSRMALRSGDLVGLQAYGADPGTWLPPRGGKRQLTRMQQAVSELRAEPEETNHVLGIHRLLSRLRRRSMIVVFTEFTDATTAELMVEHLGTLARRHLVVFVALDDPAIEAPLESLPHRPEELAAAVVAGGMRTDRHRVLRRLRRMGVDVIHGPAGAATLELLARYVQIKRKGRIG